MADLRAEVWSRPGAATFEKIWEDPQAVRFGGTVRVSGTGDGEMTLPDTADTHELADLLLLTDPDTPANSTRALVRVFKDGDVAGTDDPLHEWRVSSVVPPTDDTDPVWEVTGLDPFDFLNDAEVKPWDWDGTNDFTSLFPDWIFGGRNLLKDIESQFRPHTVEVYTTVQVDETQSIFNDATGGDFTLSFDGQGPTGAINWNAGANTIKTALELLSNITEVTVTGTQDVADPWLVTFNDPGSTDVAMITADDTGLTGETIGTTIAEVLKGNTGGTFTISVNLDGGGPQTTAAIAYNATPVQVDAALTLLGYVTDVAVAGEGTETRPYRIQFVSPAVSATGAYVITVNGAGLDNGDAFIDVEEPGVLVPKGWEESKSYVSTLNHGVNTEYRLSDGTGGDPALPACDSSGWSILFNGTEPYYPGIQKPTKVKPGGIYQGSVWAYSQGAGADIALVVRDLYENLFGATVVTLVANTWTEISVANVAIPATTSEVLFRVGHVGTGDPPPVFIACPQFLEGLPAATIGDIWEQLYDDATTNHSGVRIVWEDESASLPGNLFLVLDFTDLVDSAGAGWTDSEVAITGKRGWSYSTFMKETVKLGYETRIVSAATDGQWKLQIYNPGTLGTNYTGDDAIGIRVGRDVIRKAVRRFLPAGTAITVEGDGQQFSLRADANAVTALGRLERYSPDRDIMTLTETGLAATAILAKALAKGLSIQPVLSVGADDPQPLVDWTAGDTLDIDDPDEGVTFTARVAALTYAVTDSVTYEPALSSESFVGTSAVSQGVRQLLEAQDAIRREPPADAPDQISQEAWNAGGDFAIRVAASNAPSDMQALADYVCSGVADQVDINLALAALPLVSGNLRGRVLLSPGTFNISGPIIMSSYRTEIVGTGRAATNIILTAASVNMIEINTYSITVDGIELDCDDKASSRGVYIDHTSSNDKEGDIKLLGVGFSDAQAGSIVGAATSYENRLFIWRCSFNQSDGGTGQIILTGNGHDIGIEDCRFYDGTVRPITITGTYNGHVTGNSFRDNTGTTPNISVPAAVVAYHNEAINSVSENYTPAETDTDAIHDNVAAEISVVTEKVTPASADLLLIEDSAAANVKKRVQIGNLAGVTDDDAIHDNVAAEISAIAAKGTPTTSDYLVIEDAAAADAKKSITIGDLPAQAGLDSTAIHDNVAAEISAVAAKAVPVSGDFILIEDSAAADVKKSITVGDLPNTSSDTDAIHDNVASEISVVTEKVAPTSGDFVLIEDVAAANVKKRVQLGNLPSSSGTIWLDPVPSGNAPGGTDDDEFDNDTKDGLTETTVSGSATWTELNDVLSVKFGNQTSGDAAVALKSITGVSAPITIETAIRIFAPDQDFTMAGLCFTDGTAAGSNVAAQFIYRSADVSQERLRIYTDSVWGGTLTAHTNAGSPQTVAFNSGWIFLRLLWTAANTWNYQISPDGVSWTSFANANDTVTMTPTHFGLWVSSYGAAGTEGIATFEYFRRT